MKKKIICLLLACSLVTTLTACKTTSEEKTPSSEMEAIKDDTVEISTDASETETDTELADTTEDNDFSAQKEAMQTMLSDFLNWTGYLYFYVEGYELDTLSDEAVLAMTGMAMGNAAQSGADDTLDQYYHAENGRYFFPEDAIDGYTMKYFGRDIKLSAMPEYSDDYAITQVMLDGYLAVPVGDWGEVSPDFTITDVTENADGSYDVMVNYKKTGNIEDNGTVYLIGTYTIAKSDNAGFGYVIQNVVLKQP